jgi:uncharacterized membrane protein YgcG
MYIFYGLVLIVVIVAYIRVKNAKGEIEYIDEDIPAPVKPRKRKPRKSSEDEWWYQGQGESSSSDHGGFDGGGSHDGGGSSTHF